MKRKRYQYGDPGDRIIYPPECELPRLTREEETALIAQAQAGDVAGVAAMHTLVNRNFKWIVFMAKHYWRKALRHGRRINMLESISLASQGYIEAIYKHDLVNHADVSLGYYSEFHVARHFRLARTKERLIHIPAHLFGRDQTGSRYAPDLKRALRVFSPDDLTMSDDGEESAFDFTDTSGAAERDIAAADAREAVTMLLDRVDNQRERFALRLVMLQEQTFHAAAEKMQISATRVQHIVARGLRRLQEYGYLMAV